MGRFAVMYFFPTVGISPGESFSFHLKLNQPPDPRASTVNRIVLPGKLVEFFSLIIVNGALYTTEAPVVSVEQDRRNLEVSDCTVIQEPRSINVKR